MRERVAEHLFRTRLFGPKLRLRVDLHGVSIFGPGDDHRLIRWEWITELSVADGVHVRSSNTELRFPPGAFGRTPEELAGLLESAKSIENRATIIGELASNRIYKHEA